MTDRTNDESDRLHGESIATIDREELRDKLERGDDFELVMTIGEFGFRAKHIPGSIHVQSKAEGLERLDPDDEIVVYCATRDCIASIRAYELLEKHGYTNVRRYPGGIADWEAAGYPVAGRKGTVGGRSADGDEIEANAD